MTVFYSIEGTLNVTPCKEVQDIVNEFNDNAGSELSAVYEKNSIDFEGGILCSYVTVNELDELIHNLNPYITKPTALLVSLDNVPEKIYLGPDIEEFISDDTLKEILELLTKLTTNDKEKLKEMLNGS